MPSSENNSLGHQHNPYKPAAIAAVWYSYCNGKRFDFKVTQEQIERSPAWLETEPHPPLSARQAIALAEGCLQELVSEPERWRLGEVTLKPFGNSKRWTYLIRFLGFHPPNRIDGRVPDMTVVVLMNGEVIEPVVTEHVLP